MVQDALILYAPDGGGRSWNLLFRREFNDWETRIFYSFFEHVSARIPRGESDDVLICLAVESFMVLFMCTPFIILY